MCVLMCARVWEYVVQGSRGVGVGVGRARQRKRSCNRHCEKPGGMVEICENRRAKADALRKDPRRARSRDDTRESMEEAKRWSRVGPW